MPAATSSWAAGPETRWALSHEAQRDPVDESSTCALFTSTTKTATRIIRQAEAGVNPPCSGKGWLRKRLAVCRSGKWGGRQATMSRLRAGSCGGSFTTRLREAVFGPAFTPGWPGPKHGLGPRFTGVIVAGLEAFQDDGSSPTSEKPRRTGLRAPVCALRVRREVPAPPTPPSRGGANTAEAERPGEPGRLGTLLVRRHIWTAVTCHRFQACQPTSEPQEALPESRFTPTRSAAKSGDKSPHSITAEGIRFTGRHRRSYASARCRLSSASTRVATAVVRFSFVYGRGSFTTRLREAVFGPAFTPGWRSRDDRSSPTSEKPRRTGLRAPNCEFGERLWALRPRPQGRG